MILPIYTYGNPVLRKEAQDIDASYPELQTLIANMYETLKESDGIGLAAPQIGLDIRLVIIDLDVLSEDLPEYKDYRHAFINPYILEIRIVWRFPLREVFTEEKSWERHMTCPELFQNEEMN